ncbi:NarK family nitrate/nitrite MFS transporter [Paenalcaligenes faecalis]|uniref:NarK family nitrate/nitrite MFS transporter n=1 Tax=Paenalcaligenes faecalis TaxID=2980099 RepID=UPI0022B9B6E1|nr:NarK family nitrate/nitrite MFS transporter [Paenalcaligenes faecalis]
MSHKYVLTQWQPENTEFWKNEGSKIAYKNLFISIPALVLAFSVWMLWSIVAVNLNKAGFNFTPNELFWLAALPSLSGAILRIFYSFLVPIFGGRRWTAISTAMLLIPTLGIGFALKDSSTSYTTLLILALLCGLGGGNFSSSMANISFFFPKARKGLATGLNAGVGNLGVSLAQFAIPIAIGLSVFGGFGGGPQVVDGNAFWMQNAGFIWVPFIVVCSIAAWFGMNDIADAKGSIKEQVIIFKRKHNWIMCWLYVGTFGSFIGFSAGFAMLSSLLFPESNAVAYAFLGPLIGSLTRSVGGWISDKLGGAKVTLYTFAAMTGLVIALFFVIPSETQPGNFFIFLGLFIVLFALTGIGNGSTFRMIPVIFALKHARFSAGKTAEEQDKARLAANKESAAVLGFTGAVGAFGGFFIPRSFGTSIAITGGIEAALVSFVIFYLSCMAITWWFYARRNAPMPC